MSMEATAKRATRGTRAGEARMGQAARIAEPRLVLMGAVIALVALGLVMVFSASAVTGLAEGGAQSELFDQLAFIALGSVIAIVVARGVGYRTILAWAPALVLVSILALLFTRVAGVTANGSTRWLSFGGISIQPSEFAKICIVCCVVRLMAKFPKGERLGSTEFLLTAALCVGALFLVLIQPDKGTVFVTAIALWVLAISDGYDQRKMIVLALFFVGCYLVLAVSDDYSRRRVMALLNPFADEADTGYQLVHGIFAFASGGLFGRGLGMGLQKYSYLPEAHNDFILAVIGEELGLVGVIAVFACFGLIAWAGLRIAQEANDVEGRYLAMGCVALLVGQAALNFAGVLGVAPMTGKAVPFVSAGGSSMLASLIIVGLLANVSMRSTLGETPYEARRRRLRLADAEPEPMTGRVEAPPASALAPLEGRVLRLVPGAKGHGGASRSARRQGRAIAANGAQGALDRSARGTQGHISQGRGSQARAVQGGSVQGAPSRRARDPYDARRAVGSR